MREPNNELRSNTYTAFKKYGGQSKAAQKLGVTRAYVWQILNGERDNDELLLKLSDFILERINQFKKVDNKKKENVKLLKVALA